jgi:hypothetical protein
MHRPQILRCTHCETPVRFQEDMTLACPCTTVQAHGPSLELPEHWVLPRTPLVPPLEGRTPWVPEPGPAPEP